jgi:hypothetical protein
MEYKRGVVEVILRSSDGLGRNLWPTAPRKIKCPRSDALSVYMRTWFPYWRSRMWTWDEAIGLFGLEHDYDFFYAFLAHKELEKRNPTPIEKLDLRTVNDSYPFNVKPNDYWKAKEETSNYRVGGDNMEVADQYDLHQSDIDNVSNWKEIADSLDDSDLTDLTKIFGL